MFPFSNGSFNKSRVLYTLLVILTLAVTILNLILATQRLASSPSDEDFALGTTNKFCKLHLHEYVVYDISD